MRCCFRTLSPHGTAILREQGALSSQVRRIFSPDCPVLRTIFDKTRRDFGSIVHIPSQSEARKLIDDIVERFKTGRYLDRYQESELLYRMLIAVYRQQVEGARVSDPSNSAAT